MTTNQDPSTGPDTTDDVEGNRFRGGFDPNNDTQTADEVDDVEGNAFRRGRVTEGQKDKPAHEGDDTDGHAFRIGH